MTKNCIESDEELVHRALSKDQDAFSVLYNRYLPSVFAHVSFKVPEGEVEDITQDVFVAIMRSLDSFQGKAKFSTWIWSITSRKIADFYRKNRGNASQPSDIEETDMEITNMGANHSREQSEFFEVKQALEKLPANYQEIILLRFVDEVPFQEIARQKGETLEATKSLFRRSVAALRKEMVKCDEW